jgi:hypothetical protein
LNGARSMRTRAWVFVLCAMLPACLIDIDPSLADKKTGGATKTDAGIETTAPGGDTPNGAVPDGAAAPGIADAAAAVPADLVGSWSFEEQTGPAVLDGAHRGHDGTIDTGVVRAAGKSGRGLSFSGGAPLFAVTSLDGAGFPTRGTLVFWFKPTTPAQAQARLFDTQNTSGAHLFIEATSDVVVTAGLASPDDFDMISVNRTASADGWSRISLVWNPSGGQLTVDTRTNGFAATVSFVPSGQRFRMGAGFTGSIDEVRLYNRTLSAAEIAALP